MAKSILGDKARVQDILEAELQQDFQVLDESMVGTWIEKHTGRLNVLIPAKVGPHVLSLIEAFLHCRLQPLFEGHG